MVYFYQVHLPEGASLYDSDSLTFLFYYLSESLDLESHSTKAMHKRIREA